MEIHVILGNQLFETKYFKTFEGHFFMCEDIDLCKHYRPHKAKIYLFLVAMREFRDQFDKSLDYFELEEKPQFFEKLAKTLKKKKAKKIKMYEIEDRFFEKKMSDFCEENKIELEYITSPNFICSRDEFSDYIERTNKPFMKTFYEEQRLKHDVLMDGEVPIGGKYSFDSENRKKVPKKFDLIDEIPPKNNSKHRDDVLALIDKYFSDHPGDAEEFYFPTNHKDAAKHLDEFFKTKMQLFGDYEDAIDERNPFLYHSLVSPLINIGLLHPLTVVKKAQKALNKDNLNSVEGFIRQVMGWREFMRGIYHEYDEVQQKENFFGHKKKLKACWRKADTGIPVVDKTIKKVLKYGYCHHIERLMVLSNLMLILEVDPREVHAFFMEMFIDSLDWVMGPNVYGMGQFSDGGIFATKPYFSGSNYILKMSHEKKGDWCDEWDGLYWSFIDRNREFFSKNYRMSMMVSMFDKMDEDKKKRIAKAADKARDRLVKG